MGFFAKTKFAELIVYKKSYILGFDWPQMDKNWRSYSQKRKTHCLKVGQNLGVWKDTPRLEILQNGQLGSPQFPFPGQFLKIMHMPGP